MIASSSEIGHAAGLCRKTGTVSIADFALYPLAVVRQPLIERAGDLPNLTRWTATMALRPAVQRAMLAAA